MIDTILDIIDIILSIIIIVAGIKYKKIRKALNHHFRKCINCGYSRDDIADEWEIFATDDTHIRCQKCGTVQFKWKNK